MNRDWLEVLVSVMDCSGGYGFPPKLDACDPIDKGRSGIIKNLAKYGGERV